MMQYLVFFKYKKPVEVLSKVYLIFQSLYYALKTLSNNKKGMLCKSKGLSAQKFTTPFTTDNSNSPKIKQHEYSKIFRI